MNNSRKSIILFLVLAITILVGIGMVSAASTSNNNTTAIDDSSTSQVSTNTIQSDSTSALQTDVNNNSKTKNNNTQSQKDTTTNKDKTNTTNTKTTKNTIKQENTTSLSTKNLKSVKVVYVYSWEDMVNKTKNGTIEDGDTIKLASDIVSTGVDLPLKFNRTTLDGDGHSVIFERTSSIIIGENLNITIRNVILNGNGITSTLDASKSGVYLNIYNSTFYQVYGQALRIREGIVNNCSFLGCLAQYGSAIFINGTEVNITNSRFVSNIANSDGGAIYNYNSNKLLIENNTFSDNSAKTSKTSRGNVIYNICDNVIIRGNNFTSNSGNTLGTIYNSADNILITGNNFISNDVYYGSAVYNTGKNVSVTGNNFTNNTALYGVIYNEEIGEINTTNNIYSNNTATENGGAIYNLGSMNVTDDEFNNNTARYGAGIYFTKELTLTNSIFYINKAIYDGSAVYDFNGTLNATGNKFTSNAADSENRYTAAGTVYINNGTVNLTKNTFDSNNASSFGAAVYIETGDLYSTNNTYENNVALKFGGAIYSTEGNIYVDGDKYLNNTAKQTAYEVYYGGGAINVLNGILSIKNSNFVNNSAEQGGAIFLWSRDSVLNITNTNFTENKAQNIEGGVVSGSYHGGAIYSVYAAVNVTNSRFSNNTASEDGGAVYAYKITSTNSNFTNNTASYEGGAIFANYTINSTKDTFTNNSAGSSGGAIFEYYSDQITLSNDHFTNNTATQGGAIRTWSSPQITLSNNYFTNNTGDQGGVIYTSGEITSTNDTFVNNTASGSGGVIYKRGGNLNLLNDNFTSNSAIYGGVIYSYDYTIRINATSTTFTNINASGNGGVIYSGGSGEVYLDAINTTFTNISASFDGGVVFAGSHIQRFNVTNSTFANISAGSDGGIGFTSNQFVEFDAINTTFTNINASSNGGVLYANSHIQRFNVTNTTFANISAGSDGGIGRAGDQFITFDAINTTFTNISAGSDGGVIRASSVITSFTSSNNTFANISAGSKGGVVYTNYYITDFNSSDNTFANISAGSDGGVVYTGSDSSSNLYLYNNTFNKINASGNGGVIYLNYGSITANNNSFTNIKSLSSGGLIYSPSYYSSSITLTNNSIDKVNVSSNGGVIYLNYGSIIANNNNFTNIKSLSSGGLIYNSGRSDARSSITLNNNSIDKVNASGNGGVIYSVYSTITSSYDNFTNIHDTGSANGGIIYQEDGYYYSSSITLRNDKIVTSQINGSGAVTYQSGSSSLTIENCNITNTQALSGGVSYNSYGGITVKNNSIINSSAINGSGGVIYTGSSSIDLQNNSITNTSATNGSGGVIYSGGSSSIYVQNNNITNTSAQLNGGLLSNGGTYASIYVQNNSIINSSATNGSGGLVYQNGYSSYLYINYNNITNTKAGSNGGVIYRVGDISSSSGTYTGTLDMTFNNITNSSAGVSGGVVFTNGTSSTIIVQFNRIVNSSATNGSGGVMYAGGKSITVSSNNITNSNASSGGALSLLRNSYDIESVIQVEDNTFINTRATSGDGGAISTISPKDDFNIVHTIIYKNNTFRNSYASKGNGGVLFNDLSGTYETPSVLVVELNTFTNSNAKNGGALYTTANVDSFSESNVTNNKFTNNKATSSGGVIYVDVLNETITLNNFTKSNATNGGLIYNNGTLNVTDINFSNVTAVNGGVFYNDGILNVVDLKFNNINATNGGVIYNRGTLNITNDTFTNNKAKTSGGVIYSTSGTVTIANLSFVNNRALNGTGGAIYAISTDLDISNVNFTANIAKVEGAAIYNNGSSSISNSSFKNNLVNKGKEGGETLFLNGSNSLINNTYTNTSIAFSVKNLTSDREYYTQDDIAILNGNISLANPTYYDDNLLNTSNLTTYTLYMQRRDGPDVNRTQVGNSTFIGNLPGGKYDVYENMSIAQSTYNNSKTNVIYVPVMIGTNTTIILNNSIYSFVEVIGQGNNLTTGSKINVTFGGITKNVTINSTGGWSVKFPELNASTYTDGIIVQFAGNTTHNPLTNVSRNMTVDRMPANSTIIVDNEIIYSNNVIITGRVTNLTVGSINVTVRDYGGRVVNITKSVNVKNSTNWSLNFGKLNVLSDDYPEYYVIVTYTNKTGNYTDFINTTTFKVIKQNTTAKLNTTTYTYNNTILKGNAINLTSVNNGFTVQFDNGLEVSIKVDKNGTFTYTPPIEEAVVGKHNVNITYLGDSNHNGFNKTISVTIVKQSTNSTINAKNFTYVKGKRVTINGTVENVTVGAEVNVMFYYPKESGRNPINETIVVSGKNTWSLTVYDLQAANYTIVVSWDGDKNHKNFTNTSVLTVNKIVTNSTVVAKGFTYPGILAVNGTTSNVKDGERIVIKLNSTVSTTVPIDNTGFWKWEFSNINAGTYNVTVIYNGTDNYAGFTNVTKVTVQKQYANSTIKVNDASYAAVHISGRIKNLISGKLNISIYDTTGKYVASKNTTASLYDDWTIEFNHLPLGKYYAVVMYNNTGGNYRDFTNSSSTFTIKEAQTNTTISATHLATPHVAIAGTTANVSDVDISVSVDGKTPVTVHVDENGAWNYSIGSINTGYHNITVTFAGDELHLNFTNTTRIKVTNKQGNSTINVKNIRYLANATVTGLTNIPVGDLNIAIVNADGKRVFNKNVTATNTTTWKMIVSGLDAGSYTAIVSYTNASLSTEYSDFINQTTFTVSKLPANTTLNIKNITYPNNITVTGRAINLTSGDLIVTLYNTKGLAIDSKVVKATNTTDWSTVFNSVDAGKYTVDVKYTNTTGNFKNFETTGNISVYKQVANTTITAKNVVYPKEVVVSGKTENITEGLLSIIVKNSTGSQVGKTNYQPINAYGEWSTTFYDLTPGDYTAVVSYTTTTGNYRQFTNESKFKVNKKLANSSINVDNITYLSNAKVNGYVENITRGSLNITIADKNSRIVRSKNITFKGPWNVEFSGLKAGNYTAYVYYSDANGLYSDFTNKTTFEVYKHTANSTVYGENVNYPSSLKVSGLVSDLVIGNLNVSIYNKTGSYVTSQNVTARNTTPWSVTFNKLNVGTYYAVVSYTNSTGNYTNFNNTSTTFNVAKQLANSTISVEKSIYSYSEGVTINGTTENMTVGKVTVTVYEIRRGYLVPMASEITTLGNSGKWNVTFHNLDANITYIAEVSHDGSGNYAQFANKTLNTFYITKTTTNSTINVIDAAYGKTKISGKTENLTSGKATITVNDYYSIIVDITNSTWNVTLTNVNMGNNDVKMTYEGDDNHIGFTNTTVINITKISTNTTIKTKDIIYGNPVIINGVVSNITAGSELKVLIDNVKVGVATVNKNGAWTFNAGNINAGKHNITVTFTGDANYKSSTNTSKVNVQKVTTNTTIKTKNVIYGNPVVINGITSNITAGSDIKVMIDGVKTRIATVNKNGAWTVNVNNINAGKHNITVTFTGNNNYKTFTNTSSVTVSKTNVKLTVDNVVSKIYDTTEFIVHVKDTKGNLVNGGNVVFKINGKTVTGVGNITKVSVVGGVAKLSYYVTAVKNWTLTAVYSGSTNYNANSVSNVANLTFTTRNLNIKVTANNPLKGGDTATFKAVITDTNGSKIKSGIAIFKINGKTLKDSKGNEIQVQIVNGIATLKYKLPDGFGAKDYELTAVAAVKNYNRGEDSNQLVILKRDITIKLNKITTKNTNITVTGTIKDDIGHYLVGTNKVCVKINDKTIKNGNKTVYFKVNNGKINITIPSKYTKTLKTGKYVLTLVTAQREAYTGKRNSTTLQIL